MLVYLTTILVFSLTYSLPYLPTSLRIVPFCVQARCHKRRRNLAFVFFCVHFVLCFVMDGCLLQLFDLAFQYDTCVNYHMLWVIVY